MPISNFVIKKRWDEINAASETAYNIFQNDGFIVLLQTQKQEKKEMRGWEIEWNVQMD